MGPPHYSRSQDLTDPLYRLLDTNNHPAPIFIHPVMGIPSSGHWASVRQTFGLAPEFSFANELLNMDAESQTSLLSSFLINSAGENILDDGGSALSAFIVPESITLAGKSTRLQPYLKGELGQTANLIVTADQSTAQARFSGTLLVNYHDSVGLITPESRSAPYLLNTGEGRYLWTLSQLHHNAFTYMLATAASEALGLPPTLLQPVLAHVRGGEQTVALAYDQTELKFQMPVDSGAIVRLSLYDQRGEQLERSLLSYDGSITRTMPKGSLLVAEALPETAQFSLDSNYLNISGVEVPGTGVFSIGAQMVSGEGVSFEFNALSLVDPGTPITATYNAPMQMLDIPRVDVGSNTVTAQGYHVEMKLNTNAESLRLEVTSATPLAP